MIYMCVCVHVRVYIYIYCSQSCKAKHIILDSSLSDELARLKGKLLRTRQDLYFGRFHFIYLDTLLCLCSWVGISCSLCFKKLKDNFLQCWSHVDDLPNADGVQIRMQIIMNKLRTSPSVSPPTPGGDLEGRRSAKHRRKHESFAHESEYEDFSTWTHAASIC